MKQRFLSLLAVASMSIAAMAQSWTAPVAPENPSDALRELAADPESGTAYYIMNVGEGQFITGANVWATQISLTSNATPYVAVIAETIEMDTKITGTKGTEMAAPGNGWTLRMKEKYNLTGDHNRTQGQEWTSGLKTDFFYLFRSGEDGYVDLNNQNKGFVWNLTKNDNGYYYIQVIPEDSNFPNAATEYAGGTGAGKMVKFTCTADDADIEWIFIPQEAVNLEEYAASAEKFAKEFAIYNARVPLYEMLNDAAKYGADYSAASAVYNNADATAEELTEAQAALKANISGVILNYAKTNSTAASPVELTKYILVNPDFNTGNIDGWTVTEGIGQNQGFQNNNNYHNDAENVHIDQFIEAWRPAPNTLNDGKIYQTINGLPSGHYILECDGIARNQTAASSDQWVSPDEYRGIYLFYSDGTITVHSESTLRDVEDDEGKRLPTHFVFEFDLDNAESVQIGLMADDTNLNWMAADNFKLSMAGPSQMLPSYTALRTEAGVTDALLKGNEIMAQQTLIDALQEAFAQTKPLVDEASDSSKDAEYKSAYNTLNSARQAVLASQAAYAKLATFITKLEGDQNKYDKPGYGTLLEKVENLFDEMSAGYDNKTISADEITAAIDGYDAMVMETIQQMFDEAAASGQLLDEPLDITPLFEHMTFAYGTTQTAFANGYPAENPVWMNATSTGNFKTNYSTAEVWDARPFEIYREFTNLPKGKYTVKTHAFNRVTDNANNYASYMGGEYEGAEYAYVYAGRNHTNLTNVAELANSEAIVSGNDTNVGDETSPIWIVNSQEGAYKLFTQEAYAALAEKTYVSVSSSVIEDNGTLRAGIVGTDLLQGNQWTIFNGFELYYEGVAGLDDDIQNMLDQLELLDHYGVAATSELIENAKAAGEAALGADEATQTAAIKTMQEAINASELSKQLTEKIQSTKETYQAMVDNLEGNFNDTKVINIIDEIDAAILADEFESNEKIQEWLDALPGAWYDYVLSMQELDEATEDNAVELPILVNGTFDDMVGETTAMPTGWTAEFEKNGGKGREGVMEFWNASTFDIYQDLPKLKNGYYRLCVDGLYRAGASNDENGQIIAGNTPANDVYFYAKGRAEEKLMQWSNTESGAIPYALADKDGVTATGTLYDLNEELGGFDAPNNQSAFSAFIAQNRYHNTLVFGYGVDGYDEGTVRIGLKKTVAVANDWCPFDNFKLEYLGTERPTAVNAVETDTNAAPAAIFTLDGRQSNRLSRGVNIVRQANGKVVKVLVK